MGKWGGFPCAKGGYKSRTHAHVEKTSGAPCEICHMVKKLNSPFGNICGKNSILWILGRFSSPMVWMMLSISHSYIWMFFIHKICYGLQHFSSLSDVCQQNFVAKEKLFYFHNQIFTYKR